MHTEPADRLLVVGGDHNYPPYEFLDDEGRVSGFNVELTHAVAEIMGLDVEIRLGPWDAMRRGLENGDIDILQGMVSTSDRQRSLVFSMPHAKVHQSIWVRDGSPITLLRDLVNKDVLVMRGSVMHDFMLRHPELGSRLHLVETLEDALSLLSRGEADAALVAKLPGEYLLLKNRLRNIHPIAKPLDSQNYGYAVKKGNEDLLATFNEGLKLLERSGRYRQIYERWLGVLPQPGLSLERVLRIGLLVLLPILLLLAATFLWSQTLKRQVDVRTRALQQEVAEKQDALRQLEVRQQQLIQADKMASLGTLTSGVAHEINNPNALLLYNLPVLKQAWQDALPILQQHYQQQGDFKLGGLSFLRMQEEIPHLIDDMQQCAGRIRRIVEDLKGFARRDTADLDEVVDLNSVVAAALRLVDNSLKKATNHFQLELASLPLRFRGNRQRIEQVVVNLLLNACQALPTKGAAIQLRSTLADDGRLLLEVQDQGRGIQPHDLSKLADPFFTTKREQGGTGLGLFISSGIVQEHGGELKFSSVVGEGTIVRLFLPPLESTPGI